MSDLEFILQFKISNDINSKSKVKIMLLSENPSGGVGIKCIKVNSCSESERIIYPKEKKIKYRIYRRFNNLCQGSKGSQSSIPIYYIDRKLQ